jgi:glycosyltransferase involved in cell wall biosynthesis
MFRTLATSDNWVKRRWWKELAKHFLFARVDGVETPGNQARAYARRYNAPDDRIFYARHTVDVEHFSSGRAVALPEREKFRAELGLRGVTFVYVGRLWWGKGVNYLLDAFAELQQRLQGSEVSLLLLGDGADEGKLREQCRRKSIRNVVFAGFKQKPELPRYYTAADVFVFPTLGDPYGLVVDEAMACALPIVSTSEAGEIRDRVEEGVNGYIVPAKDSQALADKMEVLARDPEARARMGAASFEKIKDHTPEGWAKDFEAAIENIIGNDQRMAHLLNSA